MRRQFRLPSTVAALSLMALAAAGCAGDDDLPLSERPDRQADADVEDVRPQPDQPDQPAPPDDPAAGAVGGDPDAAASPDGDDGNEDAAPPGGGAASAGPPDDAADPGMPVGGEDGDGAAPPVGRAAPLEQAPDLLHGWVRIPERLEQAAYTLERSFGTDAHNVNGLFDGDPQRLAAEVFEVDMSGWDLTPQRERVVADGMEWDRWDAVDGDVEVRMQVGVGAGPQPFRLTVSIPSL